MVGNPAPTKPALDDDGEHIAHEALHWALTEHRNDVTRINSAVSTLAWARTVCPEASAQLNVAIKTLTGVESYATSGTFQQRWRNSRANAAERKLHVMCYGVGIPIPGIRHGQDLAEMFGVSRETVHLDAMELRKFAGIAWPNGRTDCKVRRGNGYATQHSG